MYVKLHDWRSTAPMWLRIDAIVSIQLLPATSEREMVTVVRVGMASHSEWVSETPEQILEAIARSAGQETAFWIVEDAAPPAQVAVTGGAS